MADVPHFALPLRFVAGAGKTDALAAVTVEQDSLDDVAACVECVIRYRPGERLDNPAFGIDDPVFVTTLDTEAMLAAISDQEPRAEVAIEDGWVPEEMLARLRVEIRYEEGGGE